MKRIISGLLMILLVGACLFAGGKSEKTAYTMVTIPKLKAAWFEPYDADARKAGKEFNIEVYMQAPAAADEAQQVRIIEDAVNQGVNAVLVVPNDANSCIPAFKRAREKGVVVLTHESPNQPEADFDIEMIDNVKFGERTIEELVRLSGDSGKYAIYVGSLTVPAHNIWADAAIALAKKKYPKLVMVDSKFPVAEDRNASRQKTMELLTVYPDLKGIIAFGSQGAPGAGQAAREKGLTDKLCIIGTTSPLEIAPFLKDGSVDLAVLWSSGDASYAMVYIAKMILDGKRDEIKTGLEIPGLGKPVINGMNILFDNPLIVDKNNCDKYNF
ncbi:autoinducer 2 ABC transporter substrate-binding protein [Treponema sp. OMZ 840]|uniref:autoinducer 2 ABC transporter substrate-binding protein n=1 Tax=Treponema sp. OMZ 840 TaxID=244313 RepID=UPI003D8EDF60